MTAYIVDCRFGKAGITQFNYEKESAEFYMGAVEQERILGGFVYVGKRVRKSECATTLKDAMLKAIAIISGQMEAKKRDVDKLSTELGQLNSRLAKIIEAE